MVRVAQAILFIIIFLLSGCQSPEELRANFAQGLIEIDLPIEQRFERIDLYDASSQQLLMQSWAAPRLSFAYNWQPRQQFLIIAQPKNLLLKTITAPDAVVSATRLEFPLGLEAVSDTYLMPASSTFNAFLLLDAPERQNYLIKAIGSEYATAKLEANAQQELEVAGQTKVLPTAIGLTELEGRHAKVSWTTDAQGKNNYSLNLKTARKTELGVALAIVGHHLQVDADGRLDITKPLERINTASDDTARAVSTYIRVDVANRSQYAIALTAQSTFKQNGQPSQQFTLPNIDFMPLKQLLIRPNSQAFVLIPVYAPALPLDHAQHCLELYVAEQSLHQSCLSFSVQSPTNSYLALMIGLAALLYLLFALWKIGRNINPEPAVNASKTATAAAKNFITRNYNYTASNLFTKNSTARISLADLIFTSYVAGLAVIGLSIPGVIASWLGLLILGPFQFLFSGLFFKLGFFALAATLLLFVGRRETFLLFYVTWSVAQAFLHGHYSVWVVIYAAVTLSLMDLATGIMHHTLRNTPQKIWPSSSKNSSEDNPINSSQTNTYSNVQSNVQRNTQRSALANGISRRGRIAVALAIGCAEYGSVFWGLWVAEGIWGLHYADWYMHLQAAVAFVYTALGTWLGLGWASRLLPLKASAPLPLSPHPKPIGNRKPLIYQARGLGHHLPQRQLLCGIDINVYAGQIIVISGSNGVGKTTLISILGRLIGTNQGGEISIERNYIQDWNANVGLLLSNTRDQLLQPTGKGLINEWPNFEDPQLKLLCPSVVAIPQAMSGGEMQRLALCSIFAKRARLLFLDEPFTHLDATAAANLIKLLLKARQAGSGIILTATSANFPWADSILTLRHGQLVKQPKQPGRPQSKPALPPQAVIKSGEHQQSYTLSLSNLQIRRSKKLLFEAPQLSIKHGQISLVEAANGSGKTSLLHSLAGILPLYCAQTVLNKNKISARTLRNQVALMPQPAGILLTEDSVFEELNSNKDWLNVLELEPEQPPQQLSSAQQQWLALAIVINTQRPFILLDEPFRGLDAQGLQRMLSLLKEILQSQPWRSILMVAPQFPQGLSKDFFDSHYQIFNHKLEAI